MTERARKEIEEREARMYDASKIASTINRQLALSGVALSWMFKDKFNDLTQNHLNLQVILLLFISSLVVDLLYYIFMIYKWGYYANQMRLENEKVDNPDCDVYVDVPDVFFAVSNIFWYTKVSLMVLGYISLLFSLYNS